MLRTPRLRRSAALRSVAMLFAVSLLAGGAPGQKVFHTVDEALEVAFGDAKVTRGTEVLSDAERERIAEIAGSKCSRGIVFPYVARREGELVGTAYFDTHRVRTLRETLMVVVTPDGRVAKVVVCAFAEPLDYMPRQSFYAQFTGRALDERLRLRQGIDGVTGATLTSRATTDGVRRVLATHRVLVERRQAEQEEEESGESEQEGRTGEGCEGGEKREGERREKTPPRPGPEGSGKSRAPSAVRDDEAPR